MATKTMDSGALTATNTSTTPTTITTVYTTVTTTTITTTTPRTTTTTTTTNSRGDSIPDSNTKRSPVKAINGIEAVPSPGSGCTLQNGTDEVHVIDSDQPNGNGNESEPTRASMESLAEEINRYMESQSGAGSGVEDLPEVARVNLVTAALKLVGAVRPPSDSIMSWFANISMVSAVRLFQHWDAFNLIPYTGRHDCISYADLAAKLQAEESLLYRIASMLTSTGVLEHVAPNHLAHTPISLLLRENEPLGSMFKVMYALVLETSTILPSYFDTYGWKEPIGPTHVPSSFLEGKPELAYFDLVSQDPARMENFMCAMSVANRGRVVTTGVYPMDFVLGAAEREPDRKIWVDVGGGSGNTVKQFLLKNPRLKGSQCVVQDLPDVCEAAQQQADKTLRGVTWVPINFHKQAPIEGAMIYYIRHIARDYSDPVLTKILRNIRSAMTRPDSKVLISEQLSSTPPNVYAAFRDYSMMSIGGKERNLEQFRVVVEDAGLKVSGVFKDKQTPQAVIECSLP